MEEDTHNTDDLFPIFSAIQEVNKEILILYNNLKLKNKYIQILKDTLRLYNLPIPPLSQQMKSVDDEDNLNMEYSNLVNKNEMQCNNATNHNSINNFSSTIIGLPQKNDDQVKDSSDYNDYQQKIEHINLVKDKIQDNDEIKYNSNTNCSPIIVKFPTQNDDEVKDTNCKDNLNIEHANLEKNEMQDSDETYYNFDDDTNLNSIIVKTEEQQDKKMPEINYNPNDISKLNKSKLFNYRNENINSNAKKQKLDSFDMIPVKTTSPVYKYKRDPLRKKAERKKLSGQACRYCVKFFEKHQGTDISMNKCSRHRDKYKIITDTPPGLWSPTIRD